MTVEKTKKKVSPKKNRTLSKQAIANARKINEEHRLRELAKVEDNVPKVNKIDGEEMIRLYLKTNKVKVLPTFAFN